MKSKSQTEAPVNGLNDHTERATAIIKAAQEVFSKKTLAEASISEIAGKAEVVDSIIYHYFKNKEDLLFCSLGQKMEEITQELLLHLNGILDPLSKLGKMIWFHLHIYDLTPSDSLIIKNLLFECRSKQSFYTHSGYDSLRKYTSIMKGILKEGIKKGVFRKGLNLSVVRDMIFGLLDEESLERFASKDAEEVMPDFPEIMDLVLAMIVKDEDGGEASVVRNDKRGRILRASERVFAERGGYAATMSEIAQRAEVAEGTIYTYFDNKKDLLFSLPEERFGRFRRSLDEVFDIKNPIRKLRRIIRYHFSYFLADRDFLRVFLLDIKLNRRFYESDAYRLFLDYTSMLNGVLDEGKAMGAFRESVDNRVFRNLFMGAFTHLSARWLIVGGGKSVDMMQEIDDVTSLLSRAVMPNNVLSPFKGRRGNAPG